MYRNERELRMGTLVYDERTDRYRVRFDVACYSYGLHCGACFDVFSDNRWKPVRLEMDHTNDMERWYIMGDVDTYDLEGLIIRI